MELDGEVVKMNEYHVSLRQNVDEIRSKKRWGTPRQKRHPC